jgi:hypothetical protein
LAAVSGAVQTTDDPNTSHWCANGPHNGSSDTTLPPAVNCNIYNAKPDVWINGGPTNGTSKLTDGYYFFAVLEPSGQADPNDGGTNNLSDVSTLGGTDDNNAGDAVANRIFHVTNAQIDSYAGTHQQDSHYQATNGLLIQLAPFDTTSNPGGVYILAVCNIGTSVPADTTTIHVDPRDCKYDAFKVNNGSTTPPAQDLSAEKTANPSFTRSYSWDSAKSVDAPTTVEQVGGSATFHYTVTATWSQGADSAWEVDGKITVNNPNTVAFTDDVTDELQYNDGTDWVADPNATCTVTDGSGAYLAPGNTVFDYQCTFNSSGPTDTTLERNAGTVTWDGTLFNTPHSSATGYADVDWSATTPTLADDTATITDTVDAGTAQTLGVASIDGTFTKDGANNLANFLSSYDSGTQTFTLTYDRSFTVPAHGCVDHNNTADFTTDTTSSTDGTTDDNSAKVTVCGPLLTSALTIGFWKTTNGQGLIGTYCAPAYKTSLATYLSHLASWPNTGVAANGPFADAAGKGCTDLKTYVTGILKGANSTNMNVMLKAQMLGTALDVYFSDPSLGYTSTIKNKVKPPSNFLTHGALGGVSIDTTSICPMIDNTTAGTATCKGGDPSTDGYAGGTGALPAACMTVQQILTYEATVPPFNGVTGSGSAWYGTNRTFQEVAKNTFDQINNTDAFGC